MRGGREGGGRIGGREEKEYEEEEGGRKMRRMREGLHICRAEEEELEAVVKDGEWLEIGSERVLSLMKCRRAALICYLSKKKYLRFRIQ